MQSLRTALTIIAKKRNWIYMFGFDPDFLPVLNL